MTMVPTLLGQLKRSLQIKKIITNAPCVYSFLHIQSISSVAVKKVGYWDTSGVPKKIAEVAQKKEQELAHDEFYPQSK